MGVFLVTSNIFFGLTFVYFNAFLPVLVHATVDLWVFEKDDPTEATLRSVRPPPRHSLIPSLQRTEKISNRLSGRAVMAGCFASIICVGICLVLALFATGPTPIKCAPFLSFGSSFLASRC